METGICSSARFPNWCDNSLSTPNCASNKNFEPCVLWHFHLLIFQKSFFISKSLRLLWSYQHCLLCCCCCRNDPNSSYLISDVFGFIVISPYQPIPVHHLWLYRSRQRPAKNENEQTKLPHFLHVVEVQTTFKIFKTEDVWIHLRV